jgi:CheY-like chemotaxis protein
VNAPDDVILQIEDDENDALLLAKAFTQAGVAQPLVAVRDSQAAMDYLTGEGAYADRAQHPLPCLVLLDLNMPGSSGIDVLKWIRRTPSVSTLPVVVLTSSNQDGDIHRAYLQGANGYLVKPDRLEEIIAMARAIKDYWLVQNRGSTGG